MLIAARDSLADAPTDGDGAPEAPPDPRLAETYLERLARHMPADLSGLAVVVDAGNGAAWDLGPRALVRAGARVMAMSVEPDGRNINHGCGALHPEGMARRTRESAAAMGVALDGDADRSIFADETGRILDGDDVLWIVAREWKRAGRLRPGGVVGTVMSNYGLEAALAREAIAFHRAAVGDRNVARLHGGDGRDDRRRDLRPHPALALARRRRHPDVARRSRGSSRRTAAVSRAWRRSRRSPRRSETSAPRSACRSETCPRSAPP